ncbi:MAG: HPr family phosphocarrier protein [Bacteroidetes bacterium]|nr:HPr family phosphocarrier protein [Rhodothermia bacterium]MCS7155729.1 HPr family phosphocarrier protein [Bacteroidota bacterium]MCX7906170.1 HPr family phosphocarrier protein [Bacteroidota bacterium]MDW8138298.1 HPr family phosphocarrier protein [Bacteroidota bacterium]MDW8285982.1 HPr family phosphocarrier protein [Bacteroidota bacterium]
MKILEVEIKNKAGLHTRPAALLVKTASRFRSHITILKDGFAVNGKSIIGVMTLAAEPGCRLTLRVEGPDEEEAARALAELFATGFGEE